MVAANPEGPAVFVPTSIGPCQDERHKIGDKDVALAYLEHAGVQRHLELIDRPVVRNRRHDLQNRAFELDLT